MAYQQGSATDLDDLLTQLWTFASANGWASDELDLVGGSVAMSKNSVFVSCRFDPASENILSVHQALAFDGAATEPGDHTDDSGNGFNSSGSHTNANLDNERHVELGNGPFTSYHFFENDSNPAYIHVAVETGATIWRHFGWGELDKRGDWTGGEYAYGHIVPGGVQNTQTSALISHLLDGVFASTTGDNERMAATLHLEGLTGMDGSSKWAQVWGTKTAATPTDTAGNPKAFANGGHRGGPIAFGTGFVGPAGTQTGYIPMYPIALFYCDTGTNLCQLLGYMPDVRGMNMRFFAAEQEVVIGGDTWVIIPDTQKTDQDVDDRSYNRGTAYRKETA